MQVTCLGATRTVTGSCFLVENERLRFLVDCGMFQGGREIERRNYSLSRYRPPATALCAVDPRPYRPLRAAPPSG